MTVKYITFIELTPEFLRLPMDERRSYVPKWSRLASKHGLKIVFWGMPMGVKENVVCVFETQSGNDAFFKFQREWLGPGTPDVCKRIKGTRTIQVF